MHATSNLIKLMNNDGLNDDPLFHCFVCDVYLHSKDEWITHASGRAHITETPETLTPRDHNVMKDILSKITFQSKLLLGDQNKFIEIETEGDHCSFVCVLCDIRITSYFALSEHLENELHRTKVCTYQSLKEEKDENIRNAVEPASSRKTKNSEMWSVPEVGYSTRELVSSSQSIRSALKELRQYFSGTLKCVHCQQSVTVDPTVVTDHIRFCFSNSDTNERTSSGVNIKDEFIAFVKNTENMDQIDTSSVVSSEPDSRFDRTNQFISSLAFQYLQSEAERPSVVAPHSYNCLRCYVTGNINKWEDHLKENHSSSFNGLFADQDLDCIVCTCTLCQVLFFGRREDLIQHNHFQDEKGRQFFLFSSYPQLKDVLICNQQLPRYYKFLKERATTRNVLTAFFCLPCNLYGSDKLKKHFQSKGHKSKNHVMFEFFYCAVCSVLIFADRLLFEDHRRAPSHIFSKFAIKSNAINTTVSFVSREHEDQLCTIRKDVLKYWKTHPLENGQSVAFWCEPCTYFTDTKEEWQDVHMTSEAHAERIKQKECFEYSCVLCKISLFGTAEFHAAHCSSEFHRDVKAEGLRHYNETRMKEKRSSVDQKLSFLFKSKSSDLVSAIEDGSKNESRNNNNNNNNNNNINNNENKQFSRLPHFEPGKLHDIPAIIHEKRNYDLEDDSYLQNVNSSNGVNKKLIEEFLQRVVQKHGSFSRVKHYFCGFCDYYSSEKSWWLHIKSSVHNKNLSIFSSDSKNNKNGQLSIMFCSWCLLLGVGSQSLINVHTHSKSHSKKLFKSANDGVCVSSPISLRSTTDDEEELNDKRNGLLETTETCPIDGLNETTTTSAEAMNSSDDEENDLESVEDELYDMIMCEESDTEKTVISDDELDRLVLKEMKNYLGKHVNEGMDKDEIEGENRENVDIEYSIVVNGIPAPVMKKRAMLKETFAKYVHFDRTFVKKSKPGSIYLVVSKNLEDSFSQLKQNLMHLKAKWGTDELTIDMNTEERSVLLGMRDHLLEPGVVLFSNRKELANAIVHMMNRYDAEANSNDTKRRIHELEVAIFKLAAHIYKNYNMNVKTHVFGSRVTGLAAENSDVDIYLQIGSSFRGLISNNVDLQQQLVVLFSKEMRYRPSEFCDITSIPFARVPIVKFKHIKSNLNCDLSFKSGLSTMNSMLVKTYLELDERIKYLVCAVKLWMKLNDLADRNLFTTYAQIWMVLFFLMQTDIAVIPTVLKLKNMLPLEQQILTVEGWNCSFPKASTIVWRSSCTLTGEELLCKFFIFYSNSSLINYVLCTLTGLKLEKKHFIKYYESLPDIFRMFKFRIMDDRLLFRKVSNDFESFCIQDPFDHCHNLTKTINLRKFSAFVELCKQTADLLKK